MLIWGPDISQAFVLSSAPIFRLMAFPLRLWPRSLEQGKVVQGGGGLEMGSWEEEWKSQNK